MKTQMGSTQMGVSGSASESSRQGAEQHAGGTPSHAETARRAYEIYMKSGQIPGCCEKNWRQAESEEKKMSSSSSRDGQMAPESKPAPYSSSLATGQSASNVSSKPASDSSKGGSGSFGSTKSHA